MFCVNLGVWRNQCIEIVISNTSNAKYKLLFLLILYGRTAITSKFICLTASRYEPMTYSQMSKEQDKNSGRPIYQKLKAGLIICRLYIWLIGSIRDVRQCSVSTLPLAGHQRLVRWESKVGHRRVMAAMRA